MRVAALRIGAEPEQWRELGFGVQDDGTAMLGPVRIELLPSGQQGAIQSWALEGTGVPASIDGLATDTGVRRGHQAAHRNGALAIDHVVVLTPSLERTSEALAEAGVECRRVREAGGIRQGFFLAEDVLIEVVEDAEDSQDVPARFWGITVEVADLDRAAMLLADKVGRVKDAVQPGRRIATIRPEASGGLPFALITRRDRPER